MNIQDGREGAVTLERPDSIPYLNEQSVYTPVPVYKQYGCQGGAPRTHIVEPAKKSSTIHRIVLDF